MKQRVVVTGIGLITPYGIGVESFWKSCLTAPDIVAEVPNHWHDYATFNSKIWAPLPELDLSESGITRVDKMQQDTSSLLATATAFQTLNHAGLPFRQSDERRSTYSIDCVDPFRTGVYIGTGIGGVTSFVDASANHFLTPQKQVLESVNESKFNDPTYGNELIDKFNHTMKMPSRFNPFIVSMIMPNACAANIGIRYSLQGPNQTNCTACSSGTVAIGNGYNAISQGQVDMALAGGVEYLNDIAGCVFRGFDVAKTLAHDYDDPHAANRPFDEKRNGFLFSEGGCALLILESLESAKKRDASIIAEIVGYAESFDAHNIMAVEPSGKNIKTMISNALKQADLEPEHIDYINTHGTGTILNDSIESDVIASLFGERPLVNSTKSLIGHTIGAAGAIEAAVTALSLFHGKSHINKNLENPINNLNYVRTVEENNLRYGISQSFAFGGNNAVLVLKKYE